MNLQPTKDIRAGERRPFDGAVLVSWQSRSGETKTVRAKCVDFSQQGARIVCESAIDFRANVFVQAPAFGLKGNASVRYCRRSGTKHIVGLLFSAAVSQAEQGRKRLNQDQPAVEK